MQSAQCLKQDEQMLAFLFILLVIPTSRISFSGKYIEERILTKMSVFSLPQTSLDSYRNNSKFLPTF